MEAIYNMVTTCEDINKVYSKESFDQLLSSTSPRIIHMTLREMKQLFEVIVILCEYDQRYLNSLVSHVDLFFNVLDSCSDLIDEEIVYLQLTILNFFPYLALDTCQMKQKKPKLTLVGSVLEFVESQFSEMILKLVLKQRCYLDVICCDNSRDVIHQMLKLYNQKYVEGVPDCFIFLMQWEKTNRVRRSVLHRNDVQFVVDVQLRYLYEAFQCPSTFNASLFNLIEEFASGDWYNQYRSGEIREICNLFINDSDDSRYTTLEAYKSWKEKAVRVLACTQLE